MRYGEVGKKMDKIYLINKELAVVSQAIVNARNRLVDLGMAETYVKAVLNNHCEATVDML